MQAILEDEPPPIVPRKSSGANKTSGKALPNTYVKMEEPKKKSEALSEKCITWIF